MEKIARVLQYPIIFVIKVYRLCISPFLGMRCRFYPTCSKYAEEALREHGTLIGSGLIIKRLLRCHPWCSGGIDPVPKNKSKKL